MAKQAAEETKRTAKGAKAAEEATAAEDITPSSEVAAGPQAYHTDVPWEQLMDDAAFVKAFLSDVLEEYVQQQRWYGANPAI